MKLSIKSVTTGLWLFFLMFGAFATQIINNNKFKKYQFNTAFVWLNPQSTYTLIYNNFGSNWGSFFGLNLNILHILFAYIASAFAYPFAFVGGIIQLLVATFGSVSYISAVIPISWVANLITESLIALFVITIIFSISIVGSYIGDRD